MHSSISSETDSGAIVKPLSDTATKRAQLYHFLELALAHPGEEGHHYFQQASVEEEFLLVYRQAVGSEVDLVEKGGMAAGAFFAKFRTMSYEEVEAAHIALFTNNYPHLPCPPYGSLFTAIDSDKRLVEMLTIKEFYQQHGVDIADSFDDLPDHICVELEFLQLLCFRENEAALAGDDVVVAAVQSAQAEFLDRFLLPFATRLADIAVESVPENCFSLLLDATRFYLLAHRSQLGETA